MSNEHRNAQLQPGFTQTTKSSVKGKWLFNTTSLLKKQEVFYLTLPQVSLMQVIIPDTMALTFRYKNSTKKVGLKTIWVVYLLPDSVLQWKGMLFTIAQVKIL